MPGYPYLHCTSAVHCYPSDPLLSGCSYSYKIKRAVKESGLSLKQICDQIKPSYGADLTISALSHSINRGTLSLNRALQILAVCGVGEVEIVGGQK